MKILIIGSGGREHALVKAFKLSPLVTEIHAIPGSDGMSTEALCHPNYQWRDFESIVQFCIQYTIDFVMIGPEDPCVLGLTDYLRERGILVIGPDKQASQLEGSKIFSKNFMLQAKVPTAHAKVVESVEQALCESQGFTPPYVLKADGLCAGKGVFICDNQDELKNAASQLFEKKIFGQAGNKALLEQFTPGYELSVLLLTNGTDFQMLPIAQDHKRLLDGQKGPNTGGMGTVAPLEISKKLYEKIIEQVILPTLHELQRRQMLYRGVLFIGLMVNSESPSVLEYNTRFGDPETQVILPLLDTDIAKLFFELSKGNLKTFNTKNLHAACVIKASHGYPEEPKIGDTINGLPNSDTTTSWVIHAGTKKRQGQFVTHGGRVLGCVGIGQSLEAALVEAYQLAGKISWEGSHQRSDIGRTKMTT